MTQLSRNSRSTVSQFSWLYYDDVIHVWLVKLTLFEEEEIVLHTNIHDLDTSVLWFQECHTNQDDRSSLFIFPHPPSPWPLFSGSSKRCIQISQWTMYCSSLLIHWTLLFCNGITDVNILEGERKKEKQSGRVPMRFRNERVPLSSGDYFSSM